jgi:prephenate dehydrogenase
VSETPRDKYSAQRFALARAMLEQERTASLEMSRSFIDQMRKIAKGIGTGRQRLARFMTQRVAVEQRIVC